MLFAIIITLRHYCFHIVFMPPRMPYYFMLLIRLPPDMPLRHDDNAAAAYDFADAVYASHAAITLTP